MYLKADKIVERELVGTHLSNYIVFQTEIFAETSPFISLHSMYLDHNDNNNYQISIVPYGHNLFVMEYLAKVKASRAANDRVVGHGC